MHKNSSFRSRYIGDRAFYGKVMMILIPMIIQQGITNFVNLLDNVMVGQLGTASISGVAVANQLVFVFNLMTFGLLAGASIFGAQYYGKGDHDGFHQTLRFRLLTGIILSLISWLVFSLFGKELFILYLRSSSEAKTLQIAGRYMFIICFQLLPFALVSAIGGALKDCGETKMPMKASVLAIAANLILNYLLIYGKFGFPCMGVAGAALATVIARYLELAFLLFQIRNHFDALPFLHGALHSMKISKDVLVKMLLTGAPLFLNETLWSTGITMINSCYAARGIEAVAATNINQTVWNLFGVVCLSTGVAIGIIAGQHLGANDFEAAKDSVRKQVFMTILLNIGVGLIIILVSPYIPLVYKTEPAVRSLASKLLIVCGLMMPVTAYNNAAYFTLRSGGKTVITFFFDCGFTWCASLPLAWALCTFTSFGVLQIYIAVQMLEFIKIIIGTILLKSGIWIQNVLPQEP